MSPHSDANLSSGRLHDQRLQDWRMSSPSRHTRQADLEAGEQGGKAFTAMLLMILTISESHSREIPNLRCMINLLNDVQAGVEDRAAKVRRLYDEVMNVRTKLD